MPVLPTAHHPVLHRLLDEAGRFPPEYADQLSNHLPMALTALAGLDADEAQMRRFFASYARHFGSPPAGDDQTLPLADWPAHRGQFDAFARLRAGFAVGITRNGRDAVLRAALPLLIPGIGAAAFHGAIRTAHAIDSQHDGELAAGLAYWAARWMPLAPPAAGEPAFDRVADWLDAIDAKLLTADAGWRSNAPLISLRMQEAVRTQAYQGLAARLHSTRDSLADLAAAAAERYAGTGNFTVLHMATAANAAITLAPWLPEADDKALVPLWHAVAAASLASRLATTPQPERGAALALDWPQVRALALARDDDHVIKLVHAMAVRQALDPRPVWLAAARRAVAAA
jgi:Tfp pilus assembly protein PilV